MEIRAATLIKSMDISTLRNEGSLAEFVSAFEGETLPRALWTHGAHVAIATLYILRYGDGVLKQTRTAIRRHNHAVGTPENAYHETLTVFWLAVVENFLRSVEHASELDAVRIAVAEFGEKRKLHQNFYSFDVVGSDEARSRWVEPDMQPLKIRFILTTY
jgi:hypothetical protein